VTGAGTIVPAPATAATCIVSIVSVGRQFPAKSIPPTQVARIVKGPGSSDPVRSAPAGLRIVWSASSVMSNPRRLSDPCMNTATRSCVPVVPVRTTGVAGQLVLPGVVRHIIPTDWTVNVTVAVWVIDPLVPLTITVYAPCGPEQDSVEVWEGPSVMLEALRMHVKPAGETVEVRAIVPVNPLTGATVIVDVPITFGTVNTPVGLAVIEKSGLATL
jgi:hypothetical protein